MTNKCSNWSCGEIKVLARLIHFDGKLTGYTPSSSCIHVAFHTLTRVWHWSFFFAPSSDGKFTYWFSGSPDKQLVKDPRFQDGNSGRGHGWEKYINVKGCKNVSVGALTETFSLNSSQAKKWKISTQRRKQNKYNHKTKPCVKKRKSEN